MTTLQLFIRHQKVHMKACRFGETDPDDVSLNLLLGEIVTRYDFFAPSFRIPALHSRINMFFPYYIGPSTAFNTPIRVVQHPWASIYFRNTNSPWARGSNQICQKNTKVVIYTKFREDKTLTPEPQSLWEDLAWY